jgi:hypothetical protein
MQNRWLGGMVAIKITMVLVSMFVQRAWHLSLHGSASEESRCGGVVGETLATGTKRIRAATRLVGWAGWGLAQSARCSLRSCVCTIGATPKYNIDIQYIAICYISPRVVDPLVHHPNEPTSQKMSQPIHTSQPYMHPHAPDRLHWTRPIRHAPGLTRLSDFSVSLSHSTIWSVILL